MAQITINIPDELAQQLAPFQSQFSDLFTRLIATAYLYEQLDTLLGFLKVRAYAAQYPMSQS